MTSTNKNIKSENSSNVKKKKKNEPLDAFDSDIEINNEIE